MTPTSGPVKCSSVKGLLHLDEPWWCDTGIRGRKFVTQLYDGTPGVAMDVVGRLYVPFGYIWDGTSRPIVRAQGKDDLAPSLVHDALYEGIRTKQLHASAAGLADALYVKMLKERGVGPVRRFFRRAGLFLFGWTARRPNAGPEYPRQVAA